MVVFTTASRRAKQRFAEMMVRFRRNILNFCSSSVLAQDPLVLIPWPGSARPHNSQYASLLPEVLVKNRPNISFSRVSFCSHL